jgi:hypothetical protein
MERVLSTNSMRLLLTCLLLTIGAGTIARANTLDLQMVGEARLKVLFWPVYDSRLFSADGKYLSGQRPLRLEIQYLRDIKSKDLVERTAAEWQAQKRFHPDQEDWLQSLAQLWPDVRKNDVIALELMEDRSSRFYVNGEFVGAIEHPLFGQHFLAIWLSPETTRPLLRQKLLGQS